MVSEAELLSRYALVGGPEAIKASFAAANVRSTAARGFAWTRRGGCFLQRRTHMNEKIRFLLMLSAAAGASLASAKPAPETVNATRPSVTVRFPGGNYGSMAVKDGLAVVSSGWSREDGVGVFDVSGGRIEFLERFPARGYSCANPVIFGSRCYVPNGFSGTVIDLSDRRHPKLAGYLNPQFPQNGCSALWVEDGALYFRAHDGVRKVGADGFSSEKVDRKAPRGVSSKKVTADGKTVEIAGSCLKTETDACPFVFNLSTLAVADGTVYVLASNDRNGRLLPLDVSSSGLRRFGAPTPVADLARTNIFTTMGMQTGGAVTRVGDLFFLDDGLFRRGKDGAFEKLRDRTCAVANASVDGTRIALAQVSRCRVMDFSDPGNVRIVDVAPKTEKPLHITGCVLRGNDLYLAYTLVEKKGQDFIYVFPTKGYVAHVDLTRPSDADSTVEIAPCVAMEKVGDFLYVTGRKGVFTVVDAAQPKALRVRTVRDDLLDGDGYKIKRLDGRVFLLNGHRIAELDVSEPAEPQVKALYLRGVDTAAPSYDDFTVEAGRLYALAHCSVDVFTLDDPARTTRVANDCGSRGIDAKAYEPADAKVFEGHVRAAKPPAGVEFRAGIYGNSFGAAVHDWVKLADGRYAVAYGEAGVVLCGADGSFVAEPGRDPSGWTPVVVLGVTEKDGVLYVQGHDGKAFRVRRFWK